MTDFEMDALTNDVTDLARRVFERDTSRTTDVVKQAAEHGLLAVGVEPARGGEGGSLRIAGAVAVEAGRALCHPAVLHQQIACQALSISDADVSFVTRSLTAQVDVDIVFARGASNPDVGTLVPFGRVGAAIVVVENDATLSWTSSLRIDSADGPEIWLNPMSRGSVAHVPAERDATFDVDARRCLDVARVLAAAYVVGAAEKLLAETVDYVSTRKQFGAPVGSFQAIKHILADASTGIHHARTLTFEAMDALQADSINASALSRSADLVASESARALAEGCLHSFGGLGFTWEADAHLYLKTIGAMCHWPLSLAKTRVEVADVGHQPDEARATVGAPGGRWPTEGEHDE